MRHGDGAICLFTYGVIKSVDESKQDFTSGSIFGKMMQFMVPILGAQILQAMYGAVDMLVVGHFGTNAGISGVSTGSSIMNLVTFVLSQLAAGVMILIGRYLGERKNERIGKLIGGAIAFFLIVSAVLTVALIAFAEPIAVLMQAPAEAVELTAQYIRICGVGCVFVVFYNLISCIFRGLGNSRLPLLFVGIACVVNIVGDLLLVAVFDMNVAGAAIATIAAQAVSVILSLLIIRRQKLPFAFSRRDIRLGGDVKDFVRVGAPLALQELLTNVSFLAICAFINRLGLDASNGYGIAQKIQSFVMLVPSSIMQCMASFVAQNVGANREDRARKGMLYGMGVGAGIGVVIALLALFKGDWLASLFSGNAQDIARAFEYLRGFAPEAVLTCVLFSFLGYFNGHSRSTFVMAQSIAQSFLIRLPVSYVMSIQPSASLTGVGLAVPLSTVFGIALCLLYDRRMRREINALSQQVDFAGEALQQTYNPGVSTVIAISRSYGAGGRTVGRQVAAQLGIPFYDKNLLASVAQKSGLSVQYLASIDEKAAPSFETIYTLDQSEPLHSIAARAQREVTEQIASEGGCVIVGRRADHVLAGRKNLLRVFVTAPADSRAARVAQRDGIEPDKALAKVRKADRERAEYCDSLSEGKWGEAGSYDLCLDTQRFGTEGAAALIVDAVQKFGGAKT